MFGVGLGRVRPSQGYLSASAELLRGLPDGRARSGLRYVTYCYDWNCRGAKRLPPDVSISAKPGSGDAFDVHSTNAGYLTFTTVAQDTIDSRQEEEARGRLYLSLRNGKVLCLSN